MTISRAFSRERHQWRQALTPLKNVKRLDEITISVAEVKKRLTSLLKSKSQGPDQLHPIIWIEAADNLNEPLTINFMKSLQEGKLPEDWKKASIVTIFKKGDKKLARTTDQ